MLITSEMNAVTPCETLTARMPLVALSRVLAPHVSGSVSAFGGVGFGWVLAAPTPPIVPPTANDRYVDGTCAPTNIAFDEGDVKGPFPAGFFGISTVDHRPACRGSGMSA
jgi:hypothetical protein